MPTSTFHNLPQGKRMDVLAAARSEFARVPYHQVSINQIIKQAGISRGSFYQYFRGKEDLLEYLLSDYRSQFQQWAAASLQSSGGDLFHMFSDLFARIVELAAHSGGVDLCHNLFSDEGVNERLTPTPPWEALNLDGLDLREPGDLDRMLEVLGAVTRRAIREAFAPGADAKEAADRYQARLCLLRRGFACKKL